MDTTLPTENGLSGKIDNMLARRPVIMQILRFVAIGVINTALDFIVLNFVSKTFHVTAGVSLGWINIPGFILAIIQSYFWNKYWAFSSPEAGVSLWKNFVRLVLVGALGGVAMVVVLLGAAFQTMSLFYLIMFGVLVLAEIVLWFSFGFNKLVAADQESNTGKFLTFLIVSFVGLLINSAIIAVITGNTHLTSNLDLNKNIAKVIATCASLIWNFIGYKSIVFKK